MAHENRMACTVFLTLIIGVTYSQEVKKPDAYVGKRQLNEVNNRNGIISNAIYPDNVYTKEYERYRADSTHYVSDSLQFIEVKKRDTIEMSQPDRKRKQKTKSK